MLFHTCSEDQHHQGPLQKPPPQWQLWPINTTAHWLLNKHKQQTQCQWSIFKKCLLPGHYSLCSFNKIASCKLFLVLNLRCWKNLYIVCKASIHWQDSEPNWCSNFHPILTQCNNKDISYQWRSSEENGSLLSHNDALICHGRYIRSSSSAGAHHNSNLKGSRENLITTMLIQDWQDTEILISNEWLISMQ